MNDLNPLQIFNGSNGEATKALYAKLETLGPAGMVALNLFRACKCSGRAKVYRGRGYKDDAYARKEWSLQNLCGILEQHGAALGITWGWKEDPNQPHYPWVLYVELETGQTSFHNRNRLCQQDYHGDWDGTPHSPSRIIRWTTTLLCGKNDITSESADKETPEQPTNNEDKPMQDIEPEKEEDKDKEQQEEGGGKATDTGGAEPTKEE